MNKILVTGATGWLGKRLLRTLLGDAKNVEIRCLIEPHAQAAIEFRTDSRVRNIIGDIRSSKDCRRFFANAAGADVFHLAAVIHPRRTVDFRQVNVDGTVNVLTAAERSKLRRAVVVSSSAVCGSSSDNSVVFDESSACAPESAYGRSKLQMERACAEFSRHIEVVVARAPWFYGPGHPERQTEFFRLVRDGLFPLIGNGLNFRSMVHVDNLVRGLILASQVEHAAGKTFWLADRHPYSLRKIIEVVRSALEHELGIDVRAPRVNLPGFATYPPAFLNRVTQWFGYHSSRLQVLTELGRTISCSIERAEAELGYDPAAQLLDGMRASIAWCVANGALHTSRDHTLEQVLR